MTLSPPCGFYREKTQLGRFIFLRTEDKDHLFCQLVYVEATGGHLRIRILPSGAQYITGFHKKGQGLKTCWT